MSYLHLKHPRIDRRKWDDAVARSSAPRVYACSWYLDVVSPEWEGLIENDYESVMPLPVKRFWGFRYVVQPVHSQQLGLFTPDRPSPERVAGALASIPYRYVRLCLNSSNRIPSTEKRVNLVLPLAPSYEELRSRYTLHLRRNLKKALSAQVTIEEFFDISAFVELLHKNNSYIATHSSSLIGRLITAIQHHAAVSLWLARNIHGEPVAGLCLAEYADRASYLFSFSSTEGRRCGAMAAVVDHYIRQRSESSYTLDFEGSMIPSVRRFMEGFGASDEGYYFYCRKPFRSFST